jgi:transmembrane sensor
MISRRFIELTERYCFDSLSAEERKELYEAMSDEKNADQLQQLMEEKLASGEVVGLAGDDRANVVFERILEQVKKKPGRRIVMRRWAVAATIAGLLLAGGWFLSQKRGTGTSHPTEEIAGIHDVKAPDRSRATLTLVDGRKVYLDSAANGMLATQNNVTVVKATDGQIRYQVRSNNSQPSTVSFNTLTNPRGSKIIDMTLSDGSRVWLNAGSSITYPVAFVGNNRKVTIDGEAYFEIAHVKTKPFYVTKGDMEVSVLGTHFNVKAYDNDAEIRVTLLEGSVKINERATKDSRLLKPGQQAIVSIADRGLSINNNADLDEVMAWRNDLFYFESADLKTILREFSRWYDIDVVYQGAVSNEKYFSIMKRSSSLNDVLKSLKSNNIRFTIDGKKLVIQ